MQTDAGTTERLAASLPGHKRAHVLRPGDAGYEDARALWNGRIDRRPALIVRAKGAADVVDAVRAARDNDVMLSIRGGGHHVAGHAVCDDGLMLDLSLMDSVRVDPVAGRAWVGPGARVRDVDHETQRFGLVTTGGPVDMLGIAGYTLGGGLGWTSRKHGLSCDNLVSADVVTAAGDFVHASEQENADLFWALRGGSGNFGVVTSFEFRLHEMGPQVLAGAIFHPMSAGADLLKFWRDFMREAPDELQCMPVIFPLPPAPGQSGQGQTVFALAPLWAGDPADGEGVVAEFQRLGSPMSDGVGLVPYARLLAGLDDMYAPGSRCYYRTVFLDDIPDAALDQFIEGASPVPTPWSSVFLEPMGGAIARRESDATAFPHRERMFCVTAVPAWRDPARDAEMIAWADRLFEPLVPHAVEGAYVNYLDDLGAAAATGPAARVAWGSHLERLAAIKKRWDPTNLFRSNHNIAPAS